MTQCAKIHFYYGLPPLRTEKTFRLRIILKIILSETFDQFTDIFNKIEINPPALII